MALFLKSLEPSQAQKLIDMMKEEEKKTVKAEMESLNKINEQERDFVKLEFTKEFLKHFPKKGK